MCQLPLFETILIINNQPKNLYFHQQRIDYTFNNYFKKSNPFNLEKILINFLKNNNLFGRYRLKFSYSCDYFNIFHQKHIASKNNFFKLFVINNINYSFKFTNRDVFANLKNEIIIINNQKITDCVIGNLIFLKNNQWFSPADYLLKGTQLSFLISNNQVKLKNIYINDLPLFESFMMINALNPFDLKRALPIENIVNLYDFVAR